MDRDHKYSFQKVFIKAQEIVAQTSPFKEWSKKLGIEIVDGVIRKIK